MPEKPGGTEITEPAGLRGHGLAQPRRRQIRQHPGRHRPATATPLARALGQDTAATGHHLREPARYGCVADDLPPEPGARRPGDGSGPGNNTADDNGKETDAL